MISRFERKLQDAVGDAFARVFGGSVMPQEVEAALEREATDNVHELEGGHQLAPNNYIIAINPSDHERFAADHDVAVRSFSRHLSDYIRDQGWQTYGDVHVEFEPSPTLRTGQFRTVGRVDPDADRPAPAHRPPQQHGSSYSPQPGAGPMTQNAGHDAAEPEDDKGREDARGYAEAGPLPQRNGAFSNYRGFAEGANQQRFNRGQDAYEQRGYPAPPARGEEHSEQPPRQDESQRDRPYQEQGYGEQPYGEQRFPRGGYPHPGYQPGPHREAYPDPPYQDYRRDPQHDQPYPPAQRPGYDYGPGPEQDRYPNDPHQDGRYAHGQAPGGYAENGYADHGYPDHGPAEEGYADRGYTPEPAYQDPRYDDRGYAPPAQPGSGYGGQAYSHQPGYAHPGYQQGGYQQGDYGYDGGYGDPGQGTGYSATLQLDDGSGRTYQLREGSNVVGRGQDAHFRLPDTGVSRRHFEVRWDGQVAMLADLGSTNGTTVNGSPVQDWQLADGDVVRAGHSDIIIRIV
ncbi:MAG: DUF3662 domain-containing protein [Aldersonia sp.]|nr:DUF3662 domain-containing protein [Aldersonia sp.]